MGCNIHNPKGYYEDKRVVKFHNELLENDAKSWKSVEPIRTTNPSCIKEYIQLREEEYINPNDILGFKDPRALLFLDEWHEALGDRASYVFVIRHWSSCTESLLNRHSKNLAYSLPQNLSEKRDIDFWTTPSLAAQMWLNYNYRLLEFATQHPERVMIVTQRSLFEGVPLINALNEKFTLNLDSGVKPAIDKSLLRDNCKSSVISNLSSTLQSRLNNLWNELIDIAQFTAANESPLIVEENTELIQNCLSDFKLYQKDDYSKQLTYCGGVKPEVGHSDACIDINALSILTNKCIEEPDNTIENEINLILEKLLKLKVFTLLEQDLSCLNNLVGNTHLKDKTKFTLGKTLLRIKQFSSAKTVFEELVNRKVLLFGSYYNLALCYEHFGLLDVAADLYKKALSIKHNSPVLLISYGKLLIRDMRFDEAESILKKAIESDKPNSLYVYADLLIKLERYSEAQNVYMRIHNMTGESKPLLKLANLTMIQDQKAGMVQYKHHVKLKLAEEDRFKWLSNTLQSIHDSSAESDLTNRILSHWRTINSL